MLKRIQKLVEGQVPGKKVWRSEGKKERVTRLAPQSSEEDPVRGQSPSKRLADPPRMGSSHHVSPGGPVLPRAPVSQYAHASLPGKASRVPLPSDRSHGPISRRSRSTTASSPHSDRHDRHCPSPLPGPHEPLVDDTNSPLPTKGSGTRGRGTTRVTSPWAPCTTPPVPHSRSLPFLPRLSPPPLP